MTTTIRLADPAAADLLTFLGRAAAVLDGAVRLIADGGVLAVYVPVLHPAGLLDDAATVLGLRTVAIGAGSIGSGPVGNAGAPVPPAPIDVVVPLASLRARIEGARDGGFAVPSPVYSVTWAGIAPPRGGWTRLGDVAPVSRLEAVAAEGMAAVAAALPADPGEAVVRQVRQSVWNEPIPGLEALPSGAALAAVALGFAPDPTEEGAVFELGPWSRLSLRRGQVLVKRRAWSLAR